MIRILCALKISIVAPYAYCGRSRILLAGILYMTCRRNPRLHAVQRAGNAFADAVGSMSVICQDSVEWQRRHAAESSFVNIRMTTLTYI